MNSLRLMPAEMLIAVVPCSRCGIGGGRWDRVAGKAVCPHCQEALILGEAEPFIEPTEKKHCVVCDHVGTVRFHTYPLQMTTPVEMDMCPEHLRCLLGRRLGPFAYHQLRRQLNLVGVTSSEIFLLHEAFYDPLGRAMQPVCDLGLAG